MARNAYLWVLLLALGSFCIIGAVKSSQNPPPPFVFPQDLVEFNPFNFRSAALSANLRQSFSYDSGGEAVVVRWGELDPNNQTNWYVSEVTEAVSFQITSVTSSAGGHILYVAGIRDDGVDLIERWSYPARAGGFGIQVTSGAPQSIGTPMPPYTAQEFLNGSSFTPPSPQHTSARRTSMYRGSAIGHIRSLAADPEGRFLLALSYPSGAVYQIDVIGSPQPIQVLAPALVPHLASAKTIEVQHNVAEGRKYILTERESCLVPPGHKWTLINDPNNDGIFETSVTLTSAEWVAAGLDEDTAWHLYQNVGVVLNW